MPEVLSVAICDQALKYQGADALMIMVVVMMMMITMVVVVLVVIIVVILLYTLWGLLEKRSRLWAHASQNTRIIGNLS